MLATHGGKPPSPGEVEETPISTHESATTLNRPTTRLHSLRGLFRVKVGAGILRDIRARAPWYYSDWRDAWNYRVLPATALVFFAKYVLLTS